MKKFYLLFLSLAVIASACKDPEPEPEIPVEEATNIIKDAATDYDGNTYDAVKIGDQIWLSENIKSTHYPDGTEIPLLTPSMEITYDTPFRDYPNGDKNNVETFGYLYSWPAAMNGEKGTEENPRQIQGICPNGWHLPSDEEYMQFFNYVSSNSEYWCKDERSIGKAIAATKEWGRNDIECAIGCKLSTNNATGFSALPAGAYVLGYHQIGLSAYFWSSTEWHEKNGWAYYFFNDTDTMARIANVKWGRFSVRCVQN